MPGVRLIHWNREGAGARAKILEGSGYTVDSQPVQGPDDIRNLRQNPPDVFVIDLTRLPSHGRDLALSFRQFKSTRNIPIVFIGGDPKKVLSIKKILPDAFYSDWDGIIKTIDEAISSPPKNPIVPKSVFAGYSGRPMWKKLGIKSDYRITLINPPDNIKKILGDLPSGVSFNESVSKHSDLTILFTKSQSELGEAVERISKVISDKAGVWIAWPKKSSGVATDITQNDVRNTGLEAGLVDYKICAFDATWSGLLFTRRKKK